MCRTLYFLVLTYLSTFRITIRETEWHWEGNTSHGDSVCRDYIVKAVKEARPESRARTQGRVPVGDILGKDRLQDTTRNSLETMRGEAGSLLAGTGGKEHGDGTSDGAVHTGEGSKGKEG